jgi:F-type H+-transporting ATPase subunit delta
MDEGKIAVRYARALLGLAKDKGLTELVKTDMEMIRYFFENFPGFNQVLNSPVIQPREKRVFLEEVFSNNTNPLTFSFLMLLLTNHREDCLSSITRNFLDSYRKEAGYKEARLCSAIELDPATIEQFRTFIRDHYHSEVDLTCTTDSKLIGGFVLQVEDQQIDASVASKLLKLKRELFASQS